MKRTEAKQGHSDRPEILTRFNSRTRNMVENVVIDWMDKYFIDDSNLAVKDFDDPKQIENWVKGVWGRITHQLIGSGMARSEDLEPLAAYYFNDQISHHRFYDKIKPHLPGQRAGTPQTEEGPRV